MELVELQFIFLCCVLVICVSIILGIIVVAILSSSGIIKSKEPTKTPVVTPPASSMTNK